MLSQTTTFQETQNMILPEIINLCFKIGLLLSRICIQI